MTEQSGQMLNVISITRNTIHNGPGLRTLVLFKGCPLHCVWCSTPESQKLQTQLFVNEKKCIQCGNCEQVCKRKAIHLQDGEPFVDRTHCDSCLECTKVCHTKTLIPTDIEMTISKLVSEIIKAKPFFETSGGGVTLSGGEFTAHQFEKKLELIRRLKKAGISIGVDTCGYAPREKFEQLMPDVDFFLWDIKQMNSDRHKELTGVGNESILENLRYVSEKGVDVYLRCPIIPEMTDDEQHIHKMCELAKTLPTLKSVDLLPVHHLGKKRYEMLGMEYPLENVMEDKESMKNLKKIVMSYDLPCRIVG